VLDRAGTIAACYGLATFLFHHLDVCSKTLLRTRSDFSVIMASGCDGSPKNFPMLSLLNGALSGEASSGAVGISSNSEPAKRG
jgi:hypothetical protein